MQSLNVTSPYQMKRISLSGSTGVKGMKNGRICLIWAMSMIRRYWLLWAAMLPSLSGHSSYRTGEGGLSSVLTKVQYETFFPHHHPLYSYEALVKAAATYPLFAGTGEAMVRRRELAAFFAEVAHETTGGWTGAPGVLCKRLIRFAGRFWSSRSPCCRTFCSAS